MLEILIISFFIFILGAVFGSFGSVLLWRLKGNIDKSTLNGILFGRSQCPSCENWLTAKDLVPFFSWLFFRGKCRNCKTNISFFYPMLELFSGIVFLFSFFFSVSFFGGFFLNFEFIIFLVFFTIVNWILLLLIFGDFLFYELNVVLWLFLTLSIIFSQFIGLLGDFHLSFIGGVLFFSVFFFLYWFSKFYVKIRFNIDDMEGIGGGDVMVAFTVGLLAPFILSFNGLEDVKIYLLAAFYILLSSFIGIVFYLLRSLIFGKKYGQAIPFLPAMIVGFWVLLIFADYIFIFYGN